MKIPFPKCAPWGPGGGGGSSTAAVSTGTILPWSGAEASLPTGYLICDGAAVSRVTFATLFALYNAAGLPYGIGDGVTTFNVPDLRGRALRGKDNMGGTAANRLTNAESGITGTTLGAAGGVQSVALTTAQLAAHAHVQQLENAAGTAIITAESSTGAGGNNANVPSVTALTGTAGTVANMSTQNAGSGNTHNNTGPTLVSNYMVKT